MAEPRLVIEVGSPSTDTIDKFEKLQAYMTLPTVEEIRLVLVDEPLRPPGRPGGPEGWGEPHGFIGEASFRSPVLGVTVALADIYRFTPLGRAKPEFDVDPVE